MVQGRANCLTLLDIITWCFWTLSVCMELYQDFGKCHLSREYCRAGDLQNLHSGNCTLTRYVIYLILSWLTLLSFPLASPFCSIFLYQHMALSRWSQANPHQCRTLSRSYAMVEGGFAKVNCTSRPRIWSPDWSLSCYQQALWYSLSPNTHIL